MHRFTYCPEYYSADAVRDHAFFADRKADRAIIGNEATLDVAAAERDILSAGKALIAKHPEIGAIVLECTNMIPYARSLSETLGLPVHDMYSFACWFHAGLQPREFGFPGNVVQEWRGR